MELERRDIPLDRAIFPRHLKYLPLLRERCPQLRMVIDHLAKPPIAAGLMDQWAANLETVARLPKIWCKLSGLVTEADATNWTSHDLEPYVKQAVVSFGHDRLMFGMTGRVYQQVVDALNAVLGLLAPQAAAKVWAENAGEFYALDT